MGIKEKENINILKNKIFKKYLYSDDFEQIETWAKVADLFGLSNSESNITRLNQQVYTNLDIANGNKKLDKLKTKILEKCLGVEPSFSKPETWLKVAEVFKMNDLVENPERETKWKELNNILNRSEEQHLSEENFKEYVSKRYREQHNPEDIKNLGEKT